jgi:NAD(P)-dependent dehydrogenase (short-subunit alcohol dehydrogenase family)
MATILITGANRGIGLELVRQHAARGDSVIAVCRQSSPELKATGARIITGIDVSDDQAVQALVPACSNDAINVLLLNAGMLTKETLDDLDFERIRRQYEVNTLGPLRVVKALLDNLSNDAKVVIVTSRVGSIEDNGSGGNYGYRMSKAAVNMAGANLALDLKPRGIAVLLIHPGLVATNMTDSKGIEPAEAAEGIIARTDELTLAETGTFRHANGDMLPW